ncbi:hypothetical protein ACQP2X_39825 [Actinoplanes sp. CA-131856]
MPGKDPYSAFSAFVTPLTDALKCVADPKLTVTPGGLDIVGVTHGLYLTGAKLDNDGYLPLQGKGLELRARMKYQIVKDDRADYGPYRVTTRGYDYSIRSSDGTAVVDYHWHPTGKSHEKRPHLHLGSSQLRPDAILFNKQHMLCGRITFEAVIRNLIEMGVQARSADWSDLLDLCETPHLLHRTWTNDYEQETGKKVPED